MNKNHVPYFSIVIPCLNEEKYLPKLLKDLANQTFKDFEVIVVDGISDDGTVRKARTFQKKLPLTILSVTKRNVSFQRNTGAAHTQSEWVIFMDADNRLPNYFLDGIKYQLAKFPEVELFTTWLAVESSSKMDKLIENTINLDTELYNIIGKAKGMGALLGVKCSVIKEYQFDESQGFLEDGMLVKEIRAAGHTFKIFREPKFYYSLRRIKKVGNLRMLQTMLKYQFRYLLGGDFSQPFSTSLYPMLGGSYYEPETTKQVRWFTSVQHFIKTASNKQLEQARHILKLLRETD